MKAKMTLALAVELSKPGIALLALGMGALGYWIATGNAGFSLSQFLWTMTGMALLGVGSGALNQLLEKDRDSLMDRTSKRPIPSGRASPEQVLRIGLVSSFAGVMLLLITVNAVAAVLGALTLFFYLGLYTPLKPENSTSTLAGAIPGALPPLIGHVAAFGTVSPVGMALFTLLFLWQIPHFLAIGAIYEKEYAAAGFKILNVIDVGGELTAAMMVTYSLAMVCVSLLPSCWGEFGTLYLVIALAAGGAFIALALVASRNLETKACRRLFFASIWYLPLLGIAMIGDKLIGP